MTGRRLRYGLWLGIVGAMAMVLAGSVPDGAQDARAAPSPPIDEPSTWNSILDDKYRIGIVKSQLAEIKTNTRSKGMFLRGYRKLELSGHIIALMGNVGTYTNTGAEAAKSAALRDAGLAFASAAKAKDFEGVQSAAKTIAGYPDTIEPATDAQPAPWTEVYPLDPLMKTVKAIDLDANSAIRKTGSAFAKSARQLSYDTRLLAGLALVAREHRPEADWKTWCDQMCEGSVALSEQFERKDADGSKSARNELQKSCTECHDVYRKEE